MNIHEVKRFADSKPEQHLNGKLVEEMAELTQLLMKKLMGEFRPEHEEELVKELADVKLLLTQNIYKMGLEAEVDKAAQAKLDKFS